MHQTTDTQPIKNLYILDDSDFKIDYIKLALTGSSLTEDRIKIFHSRNECLRSIVYSNTGECGLLVLDITFPTFRDTRPEPKNGISVLRELRRNKLNIPVIIFSSDSVDVSEFTNVIDYIVYNPTVAPPKQKIQEYVTKYLINMK